jgi:hypothetical protein
MLSAARFLQPSALLLEPFWVLSLEPKHKGKLVLWSLYCFILFWAIAFFGLSFQVATLIVLLWILLEVMTHG